MQYDQLIARDPRLVLKYSLAVQGTTLPDQLLWFMEAKKP
jgi:hypothetical protein